MSEFSIRRVAILGAGKTGGALAAHLTNLGFSVSLLDVTAAIAAEGLEHVRSDLYVPERAGEIRVGGIDDDLASLEEADWIVEAVVEKADVKRDLYAHIAPRVRPDAVVTTCSWSIPVAELAQGMPDGFAARFFAASFTLPLAEHRLAEIRPGMDPPLATYFGRFLTQDVARRVLVVPDGPGGVVARYGLWCLIFASSVSEKLRLEIEDVEAITGGFFGQSESGIFGAIDRIGLDEIRDASTNLQARLPNDRGARFLTLPTSFVNLLARGWNGDRAGRGFYRREGREKLALNLTTMAYRQSRVSTLPGFAAGWDAPTTERIHQALATKDEVGEYLREFLVPCLRYAEYLAGTMNVSVLDFDRTMEWGFGWESGPFKLLDELKIGASQYYVGDTYRTAGGVYADIPHDEVCPTMDDCPVIDTDEGYIIHDLGDGIEAVALSEGPLTPTRVNSLLRLFERRAMSRFVLTSEGKAFPTLDLDYVMAGLRSHDTVGLEAYLAALQMLGEGLEAHVCVAAIPGRCVGPSLGLALSCTAIVASATAEIGFDEGRLGLLPTARGLALLRALHGSSSKRLSEVVVSLAEGVVAGNADLARQTGYLRATDLTEHLPERLLTTAKALLNELSPTVRAPLPAIDGPLVGLIDRGLAVRKTRGGLTDYDVSVGHRIRQVVARAATYEETLERERAEFVELGGKALTQARLRHAIETGHPLRN